MLVPIGLGTLIDGQWREHACPDRTGYSAHAGGSIGPVTLNMRAARSDGHSVNALRAIGPAVLSICATELCLSGQL